jgi:hypothetical protein
VTPFDTALYVAQVIGWLALFVLGVSFVWLLLVGIVSGVSDAPRRTDPPSWFVPRPHTGSVMSWPRLGLRIVAVLTGFVLAALWVSGAL